MKAVVNPGFLNGLIPVPAAKSMTQRGFAAALLHQGTTTIINPGFSNDERSALTVIQQLGATIIEQTEHKITLQSKGVAPKTSIINCGESGLAARLFIPIAALSNKKLTVMGTGSLLMRPMTEFITTLPQLGVEVQHQNGCLPFVLKGNYSPLDIVVDGSMSSQFLSGLLFAFAFTAQEEIMIRVNDLKSKPYIDLTLQVLKTFGKVITHKNYEEFFIKPDLFLKKENIEFQVEADWSNAAFWLAGATINGNITLENLNESSLQSDKKIRTVLALATRSPISTLSNYKKKSLYAFDFDATDCPDLFPILAVLAASANGTSTIKGLHRLTHKESNRQLAIIDMLHNLGVDCTVIYDSLHITGKTFFKGATINSCNDHRMVMAAAIASLNATAPITILGAEAVSKSYPNFFQHLSSLGINCDLSS